MIKANSTARFGLIRHAETLWNLEKRIQGHCDSPLTDVGRQAAAIWGKTLLSNHWSRILSSDTGRARQTAEIMNSFLRLPSSIDHRLREQNWGRWTAKTIAQIKADCPDELEAQIIAGWNFCPPEGERRLEVWDRSRRALIEAADRWPGATILVVTHEGVIKSLIYRLCGREFLPSEAPLINSAYLHWLLIDNNDLYLEEVNAIRLA